MDRLAPSESDRHTYVHNGQNVYQWDQTLSEVNIYIQLPSAVKAKQLTVEIASKHLTVGIQGNPPYLDKDLGGPVKVSDSLWTIEDGVLHIELTKAEEASTWPSAIAGHQIDVAKQQADQKRLMLERFQQEHPGFDFSGAQFTGDIPDALHAAQNQAPAAPAPTQPSTGSPTCIPPPEVEVKLVGVGTRGAAALQRLLANGKSVSNVADVWCVDVDKHVLDGVGSFARGVVIPKEGSEGAAASAGSSNNSVSLEGVVNGPLSAEDLRAIVGRTASDAAGRGNIGSADGGVAFVIAPAAAIPGGPALVLQLVSALRAAGHFTVAAVTAPFGFEGAAKDEQARALVHALEERAHLVAVMEQEVLLQAFGDSQLTVSEATEISDNALEHTARSVLQAVQAQEILKSSRGALMWHGRDLRHYKRLLSPPLQQLLTCPGTAVLGRGLATLPSEAGHSMGATKALMHLASDAVLAASESPFLDGALESASAVLCCINLPPIGQPFLDSSGAVVPFGILQTSEGERNATRMAAQAAAGALRSITGRSCDDFVLCVEPRPAGEVSVADGNAASVQVSATLLVLRSPNAPENSSVSTSGRGNGAAAGGHKTASSSPSSSTTPASTSFNSATQGGARVPPAQPQRLKPSNWSMLSAMAGGAGKANADAAASSSALPPAQEQQNPASSSSKSSIVAPSLFSGGKPSSATRPPTPAAAPAPAVSAAVPSPPAAAPVPVRKRDEQPPLAPSETTNSPSSSIGKERVTVGDYLAESLTAQSLDLPPAAAKWRQAQRAEKLRERRLVVWEVDEIEPWEAEEEVPSGGGLLVGMLRGRRPEKKKKVDLKSRVAGMLAQDREDAWEAEGSRDEN
ncbi:hypothetical protein KSW81_001406 [Nannochloris sp. 'desiccata']|nr:hypothetical protein KSW81_001406 [Chlorella desiccata (nom. nud.)]